MGQWINATITTSAAKPVDKVTATLVVPDYRKYIIIHNPSKTAFLAFTMDSTVPAIETNGVTLYPGGTLTSDQFTMSGPLTMISSGTSSATIYWR